MEKTMYRKVEGKLYHYYRRVRQLERFRKMLKSVRERKLRIEADIANCNHRIENPLRSQSYDGIPGSGTVFSPIEGALIQAFERMEMDLARLYMKDAEIVETINRLEEDLEPMGMLIECLSGEESKLVMMKYHDKLTYREIGEQLAMDFSTIQRKISRIMGMLLEELVDMN